MKAEHLYNAIDKKLNTLEVLGKNDLETIKKTDKIVESLIEVSDLSEEENRLFRERVKNLYANSFSNTSNLTNRYVVIDKKVLAKVAGLATSVGLILGGLGFTLTSCSGKEVKPVQTSIEVEAETISENTISSNTVEEAKIELSKNLSFDPNDNNELVNRMSAFIADSWSKGVDVPVDKMMDYYLVMNIEDINPVDYARLNYQNKTPESIMTNYFYCANKIMDDALTIKVSTKINYETLVSDIDSAYSLMELQDYIARLNDGECTVEEVHDFIVSRYIGEDEENREIIYELYNAGPNNQAYRIMRSFVRINDGKGLSERERDILNEDEPFTCGQQIVLEEGEKANSDKAQEQTSIMSQLTFKLLCASQYQENNLTNIPLYEKKTGNELEEEIKQNLIEMNAKLVENPDFESAAVSKMKNEMKNYGKNGSGSGSGSSEDSGNYGTKKTPATGVGNVTYTDTEGKEIDPTVAASYAQQGAADRNMGVNNVSSVPALYQASYSAGWSAADEAIRKAQEEAKKKEETKYTPIEPTNPVPPVNPTPVEPVPPVDPNKPIEEFVPVEEGISTEPIISYEVIDYTSKINNLNSLKAELFALANSTNEEEKTIRM